MPALRHACLAALLAGCGANAPTAARSTPPPDASASTSDGPGAALPDAAPERPAADERLAPDERPAPAAPDAGADARRDPADAAPATCAELPLCDDFEAPRLDPARWSIVTPSCSGTGTLALDDTEHHGGARSVKVVGPTGYCNHVLLANTSAFARLGAVVYGRLYVRLAQPLGFGHVSFLAMKDAADGGKDLRLGGQMSVLSWNRESDDATLPALGPMGIARTTALPTNRWVCLEFMVDGDAGRLQTWVDGREIDGLRVDTAPVPEISDQWLRRASWRPHLADLKIGFEGYDGANTVWFDDVALAGTRIGCQ